MSYAKALAGFVVPYVLILVSPLGITETTSFEEALNVIISALVVSAVTAGSVYFTKNKE